MVLYKLITILLIVCFCKTVSPTDSISVCEKLPVINGFAYVAKSKTVGLVDPSYSLNIYSTSKEVFNLENGLVTGVFEKEGIYTVIIKYKKMFFGYSNLKEVTVKKGAVLKKSAFLGTLLPENEKLFFLTFKITTEEKDFYNNEILEYLKKIKQ